MTVTLWEGVEDQRQVRQERYAQALGTAASALAPTFAYCTEAQSEIGFQARVASRGTEIERVVMAATDPTTFAVVHASIMRQWESDFAEIVRGRQEMQQHEHARRAWLRGQQREASKVASKTAVQVGEVVQRRRGPTFEEQDAGSADWVYSGPKGTIVGTTPNGWGITVNWEDGTTSNLSVLEIGSVASKTSARKTAVNTHTFSNTGEAYDETQVSDDIANGDLLVIPSEKVVGFLLGAYPVAVTEEYGAFHQLTNPDGPPPSESYDDPGDAALWAASWQQARDEAEKRGYPLHTSGTTAALRTSKLAVTAAEAQQLLSRFPDSHRERVAAILDMTIYGPNYNRNVTENLYDASKFASWGPDAADDMEYFVRKAEAQATYYRGGEWVRPMHPRQPGQQLSMDVESMRKHAGALADSLGRLDVGSTLTLGSGKIVRTSDGYRIEWEDGASKEMHTDYATVVANYYLNSDLLHTLDKASAKVRKSAAGRIKIDERAGYASGNPLWTVIYMGPEDSPGYGMWEDVKSFTNKDEMWEWIHNPDDWFGDKAALANFIATGSKHTAAWNYRKTFDVTTYTADINGWPCVVEGWGNDIGEGEWKWFVYERGLQHLYGGTPESGGDASTASTAMMLAENYANGREARTAMRKGAPFAGYEDFASCVSSNSDKDDPNAYCGYIKHKVEDTKESSVPRISAKDISSANNEIARWRRHDRDVSRFAQRVVDGIRQSGIFTEAHRGIAFTALVHEGQLHWAVTDPKGDDDKASGAGASVRDVLEDAWDALNKVLDHQPPPPKEVATQVEQAVDQTGDAVQQAGGTVPDTQAPPPDGDKTGPPSPKPDANGDAKSDAPAAAKPDAAKPDAAEADPTTKADKADPDPTAKTPPAPNAAGDNKPEKGENPFANKDKAPDDKADSGAEKGTAPSPESAPPKGVTPAPDASATPADTSSAAADPSGSVVDAAEETGNVQGIDPKTMSTGQQISMTYTLADGTTGNVDVTFVREDNDVFFFDGPKGQFGIGDRDGMWVDSEGNQFGFSDGDAMEELTGEDVPAESVVDEIDLDAPIGEAVPADGTPGAGEAAANPDSDVVDPTDTDGDGKTDIPDKKEPEAPDQSKKKKDDDKDDDDDFKKRFQSALRTMRAENLGISEDRLQTLARRAASLSYHLGPIA